MARPTTFEPGLRRPVVAGSFYPADPARLAALVDRLLTEARPARPERPLKALVVPHAGYVYSGAVAASGWILARSVSALPSRVVLAGPAHFVPLRGAAVPGVSRWRTPLGEVEIDAGLRSIAQSAGARVDDRPHEPEHSLEVQLPFLARATPAGTRILPLAVGEMGAAAVADLLGTLADAPALVVVSTDLSHYHDDATARRLDSRTVDAIVGREAGSIGDLAACGLYALRGVVELARRRGWQVTLLDRRTSADAGGDVDRVVGYAALAIG